MAAKLENRFILFNNKDRVYFLFFINGYIKKLYNSV